MPSPSRATIRYASMCCAAGHRYRSAIRQHVAGDELSAEFRAQSTERWLPIAKCPVPDCPQTADELIDPAGPHEMVDIPAGERFYAWLSPDGQRLSVPGYPGAKMPERYVRAGYIPVEAHSLRDLDRFDQIRARQTGNDVYNEMNHTPASRRVREAADYTDDMTSDV